ncbi:Oidioi.mRNA.OKI2018_I69.chr1.g3052.t1.cds [Oikopleura dioica]|uniref:Oidioi.mRNA.OKI2018_I69.chr1.g3052.t1.cds n=1 Tax=Oikopleura dioica TaxID=34765 RepID=A0ABN7SWJ2_OIKDI|nr:Oidioi.mRNA.OKI2018_I69.chr1.g3052.t1.cds [Oikopleura dioica]
MLSLIVILYTKILLISRAHLNSISEFDPKSSTVTRAQTPSVLHQSLSQSTASLSGGRRYSISNYFSQSSRSGRHQSIIAKLTTRRKASKKALRTVGLLLGCFFLTWCPFVGFFLFESCVENLKNTTRNQTLDWLLLLGMSNSLMNPIIYGRTNKEFKRFLVGLYRQARRGDNNEMTRSRASSVSIVCGTQQRELMMKNYEEKCVCPSCLAEANRSGFLHPNSDFNEKDTSMSCSALERAPALFIPARRGSTISLNVVRKFAWYKTNVATTPSCSVMCKKKIIHPVRRKKRKNQRTSKGRSRDRIDSISEFSSTSNNDVETGIGSPSSALGGLVMSPPRKEEITSEIEERAEEAPVGNQASNGKQAETKTAVSLKL